jgi:hypothetical protein
MPTHSLPFIGLLCAGDLALFALSIGFLRVRDLGSAITMFAAGLVITAAVAAYFRNAALFVSGDEVGKIDLLGRRTHVPLRDLVRTELHYSPQPNLWFVGQKGKRLFRINTRFWTESQLNDVQAALRAVGWQQQHI